MVPLIMAGVGLAAQGVKAIAKARAAKRQGKLASSLLKNGENKMGQAMDNLDKYSVSQSLIDNKSVAANFANDNSVEAAMKANADSGAGNLAGQINRSAVTSSQAATGALAAEQMRLSGYNQAAEVGGQRKQAGAQLMMSANDAIAGAEDKAYQYNEVMPFSLNYRDGVEQRNQGLAGKIAADNMKTEAFGDMMNAASSTAMAIGGAWGSGTGFDMKGKGGKGGKVKGGGNTTKTETYSDGVTAADYYG